MTITDNLRSWAITDGASAKGSDSYLEHYVSKAIADGRLSPEEYSRLEGDALDRCSVAELQKMSAAIHAKLESKDANHMSAKNEPSDLKLFGQPRVKAPNELWSTHKSPALRDGRPVFDGGKQCMLPSELELAKTGALVKHLARKGGAQIELTDNDKLLLEESFHNDTWSGTVGSEHRKSVPGMQVKALLNDSTSGGLEMVPDAFDSNVVTTLLLTGEVYPLTTIIDISRGSNVEGASIQTPTISWGTYEGTEMGLYDTSNMVSELNTQIMRATGAIEIGMDFLADSPVNVGQVVQNLLSMRLSSELDRVCCVGNGTTEPTGIFTNLTGYVDIGNPSGGAGAAPQVDDYEALLFGVPKQWRLPQDRGRCVYLANDVTYARARGIQVGASDERRVFGMDHESYTLFGHKFAVNPSIGNAYAAFLNIPTAYRTYRRTGGSLRIESGGKELTLKNLMLLTLTMRIGGRVVQPACVSYCDNMQA